MQRLGASVDNHEAQLTGLVPGARNALGSADRDFHFQVGQSSGNLLLIQLLCAEFYPLLRLYRSRNDSIEMRCRAVSESGSSASRNAWLV